MEMSMAEFRQNMATPINKVAFGGERVTLTRKGKPAVVLVSNEDAALLEALEDEADVKAALKARKEKGGVPLEKIRAQLAARRRAAGEA
ncbi:MAG TPA: type II toxin-antitoxin system Phd/YefM family antitoxin [Phycisphaerae bacterium]|nr:type II toxin-antitoxin system Phd/YefM family antitoxin [Phycisphaerae bacterium]